ncbi:MAG: dual specificity protein phosphatase [Chloroflexota bacterium]
MYQIRPWLYIGKYRETTDVFLLNAHNINAMLQFAERVEQPDITSLYLPVDDGVLLPTHYLRQGVDFILEHHAQNANILVACGAGISRSSSFVIAALKEIEDIPLFDAYIEVKRKHPQAMPHLYLWQSLCDYYSEQVRYHDVLSWKPSRR